MIHRDTTTYRGGEGANKGNSYDDWRPFAITAVAGREQRCNCH